MLEILGPGRVGLHSASYLPPVLSLLIAAAERGEPLEPVVEAIVQSFGFDSFMYGTSFSPVPGQETISHVFTTLPRDWVKRYDERAYIEVDPRILFALSSSMPLVWDQASERGKNAKTDAFLEDAAAHGVASGVCVGIRSTCNGQVVVAFNSRRPAVDSVRRIEIARNLGEMCLLGIYFHELFMRTVVEKGVPPRFQRAPLSAREKRCLTLSAHGYKTWQIATMLDISERTVEFHFAQTRTKLGVVNRQEAIAKAMDEGIIRRDPGSVEL